MEGSTVAFLEPMLPFVLKEFLKQEKTWKDFPYQLLGCQDVKNFSEKYEKVLLPVVLWFGKSARNDSNFVKEKLTELSNEVGKEGRQTLIDNFSDLVSYFLPTFVAADRNSELVRSKSRINRSKAIHQICDQVLTTKKYFGLVNEFIPEILSKILKQVQDQKDLCEAILENDLTDKNFIDSLMPSKQVMF